MGLQSVSIIGGPAPYREALEATLRTRGYDLTPPNPSNPRLSVSVVYCDSEETWSEAGGLAASYPTVVVIPRLRRDGFRRALAVGAGVVHLDTPTDMIADVIAAAFRSEALLPMGLVQELAAVAHSADRAAPLLKALTADELLMVTRLRSGQTTQAIAEAEAFSERTIRRRLQSIYFKLGATNRTEALNILESLEEDDA